MRTASAKNRTNSNVILRPVASIQDLKERKLPRELILIEVAIKLAPMLS